MKIVIILTAVLLVLGGGGIAVMKAMELGPFAPADGSPVAATPQQTPTLEPPRFVNVDPIVVPVFAGDDVAAQIQITVKLETIGSENEEKLNRLLPRLSSAFYKDLYAFVPRLLREEDRINVFVLRKRMQLIADQVAGPGLVDGVLIQSVTDSRVAADANG